MAYRPWALAELTVRRPFVDTGRLVVIHRKLPSDRVTVDRGEAFLLFLNGGSSNMLFEVMPRGFKQQAHKKYLHLLA